MIILYRNRRIKSYDRGWIVQTKLGEQWKESVYPSSLESAVLLLFAELTGEVSDEIDLQTREARAMLDSFIHQLTLIKDDLVKEVRRVESIQH